MRDLDLVSPVPLVTNQIMMLTEVKKIEVSGASAVDWDNTNNYSISAKSWNNEYRYRLRPNGLHCLTKKGHVS